MVVEDQQALASALEIALNAQPDLECVGTARTVEDAIGIMTRRPPDVVLMNIELPGVDGIEGTRRVKASHPQVRVLIVTAGASRQRLAAAASAGAAGFLTKDATFTDIVTAIRTPAEGKMVIQGTTLTELLEELHKRAVPAVSGPAVQPRGAGQAQLTAREREVLALMGEGLSPRAIAGRLTVSPHTSRGHIKSIMMKLGAHSQLEAVVVATRAGLLPAEAPPARRALP
jgi:DNA-binding NarL/FixJ family response regulator